MERMWETTNALTAWIVKPNCNPCLGVVPYPVESEGAQL